MSCPICSLPGGPKRPASSPLCDLPGETEASDRQPLAASATAARLPGRLVSLLSFHCLLVTLRFSPARGHITPGSCGDGPRFLSSSFSLLPTPTCLRPRRSAGTALRRVSSGLDVASPVLLHDRFSSHSIHRSSSCSYNLSGPASGTHPRASRLCLDGSAHSPLLFLSIYLTSKLWGAPGLRSGTFSLPPPLSALGISSGHCLSSAC